MRWKVEWLVDRSEESPASIPAYRFLKSLPVNVRVQLLAILEAVKTTSPDQWADRHSHCPMKGDLADLHEVRDKQGQTLYRLLQSEMTGSGEKRAALELVAAPAIEKRILADFMFQLSVQEFEDLKSQSVISSGGHGGRRKRPLVFTEQGIAMLSGVLRSERAIAVDHAVSTQFPRANRNSRRTARSTPSK